MKLQSVGKATNFFWGFLLAAFTGFGIAIFTGLNILGHGWTWPLAGIFFAIIVFFIISKRSVSNTTLIILETLFPAIAKFRADQQKRYQYRAIIDKAEYTLEHHQLTKQLKKEWRDTVSEGHYTFNKNFQELLNKEMMSETNQTRVERLCIEKIAHEMDPKHHTEVIELLYRELHGTNTNGIYDRVRKNEQRLEELANILKMSGHLPPSTDAFPYKTGDIKDIIRKKEVFKLNEVVGEIIKIDGIWNVTTDYFKFLAKNKMIKDIYTRRVSDIIFSAKASAYLQGLERDFANMLTHDEMEMLSSLLQEGDTALKSSDVLIPSMAERKCLNLIGLAMFFTEERLDCQNLKSVVCKLASKQEIAKKQHLAYLESREDLRPQTSLGDLPFVSVKYVAENWKNTIKTLDTSPRFQKEMLAIETNLAAGNWWTRLPPFIEDLLNQLGEEFKDQIQGVVTVIGKYPSVEEILRRIFRGLKLETIERLLEARTTTAYLFTFDGLEGRLANLVDCLSFYKGGKSRKILDNKHIVDFKHEGREKYFFTDYIAHCRLGIVPAGMSFDEFFKIFEKDLMAVYKHRKLLQLKNIKVKDFEMIIHRFGMYGRDRHGFENFNPRAQRKHALPKIQELFATGLVPEDILAALFYEQAPDLKSRKIDLKPIIEGILSLGTIWDFMDDGSIALSKSRSDILTANDKKLKDKLVNAMGCKDLFALSKLLLKSEQLKNDRTRITAINALASFIQKLPEFKKISDMCNLIAANYIAILTDIARLC